MVARTFASRGGQLLAPPAVAAVKMNDLVPPTRSQIGAAKMHIVGLDRYKAYIQQHIDALEADLSKLDPALVAQANVQGYPLTKK